MIIYVLLIGSLLFTLIHSVALVRRSIFLGLSLTLFCIFSILMVIFPELATALANLLGVGRGADLLLYFCFMCGAAISLNITINIRRQSYVITKIIRELAIFEAQRLYEKIQTDRGDVNQIKN